MNNSTGENNSQGTIEDIEKSVGILQKLANIFISIFSIFKSKESR